ncbi:Remorin family protein [Abeliophyllum distichum]|uniref:Remorin family protein n=1 Tax=Abeliophyllum distichum TaxID=126358 RepID=A0ABD1RY78_9LAMI
MDLTSTKYLETPSLFASQGGATLEGSNGFCKTNTKNPFLDTFPDPLCKLNLKETSDFVKSFPVANNGTESRDFFEVSAQRSRENGVDSVPKRNVEAPPTPGRPIFSFSSGNFKRKSFPSKWDDAEKWLVSGSSCHDSPAHRHDLIKPSEASKMFSKQCNGYKPHQPDIFAEKFRVTEEKVSKLVSNFQGALALDHHDSARAFNGNVPLKDKFTNEVEPICPKFKCVEPMKEGFLFGNAGEGSAEDATAEIVLEVKHRDIGTEMTPLGSSTTSRCPTPFFSTSPARHNTPANRSGPLALANMDGANTIDMTQLQECHLAKLQHGMQFDSVTTNWSSREEEEEDISKSLRHFEMNIECRKSISESRSCTWEEEEKTKCCLRYQREEAKIQAWVNLQNAKAEAESRKLEVKIQKMRSNLEEKLMKRMAVVHRKAEEWRATAQLQHSEQIQKVGEQARKIMSRNTVHFSERNDKDRKVVWADQFFHEILEELWSQHGESISLQPVRNDGQVEEESIIESPTGKDQHYGYMSVEEDEVEIEAHDEEEKR